MNSSIAGSSTSLIDLLYSTHLILNCVFFSGDVLNTIVPYSFRIIYYFSFNHLTFSTVVFK